MATEDALTKPRIYLSKTQLNRASSFYDVETVWTRLFPLVEANTVDPDPINQLEWLDPLDLAYSNALNKTRTIGPHRYMGEPITTVAYQHYGSTSAWHVILSFNGYLHQDEIPSGTDLEIPDLQQFLEMYRGNSAVKKDRVFTF